MPWQPSSNSITAEYTPVSEVCLPTKTILGHYTQIILCNVSLKSWARQWRHFDNKLSDDKSIKTGLMISWIHFGILKLALYVFFLQWFYLFDIYASWILLFGRTDGALLSLSYLYNAIKWHLLLFLFRTNYHCFVW